jgi:ATP-binding cassette, subfamily B, bacterial MsbA
LSDSHAESDSQAKSNLHATSVDRRVLNHLRQVAGAKWHDFALPTGLGLISAVFDGASMALLIPLTRGVGDDGYAAVREQAWLAKPSAFFGDSAVQWLADDRHLVALLIAAIVLLRGLHLGCIYATELLTVSRDQRYVAAIGSDTLRRVLAMERRYLQERGETFGRQLVEAASNAVRVFNALMHIVIHASRLLAQVAVMLLISWPITLAVTVGLGALDRLLHGLRERVRGLAAESWTAQVQAQRELADVLAMMPLIKGMSREEEAVADYRSKLEYAHTLLRARERLARSIYPLEELLGVTVLLGTVLSVIALGTGSATAEIARFCALLFVGQQALLRLKDIGKHRLELARHLPELHHLTELLDAGPRAPMQGGSTAFSGLQRGIELREVSFAYDKQAVLNGVSATFAAHQFTAVVGRTGSGKTTLLDLIVRLYDGAQGSITYDGTPLTSFDLATLHAQTAIVRQNVHLLDRDVRRNLCFGLPEDHFGSPHKPSDESLWQVLADVDMEAAVRAMPDGLETQIGEGGLKLSGGERQRLAIARALLRRPALLLLDEATSALDSATEAKVLQAIARRGGDCTVIAIAHRLSTIRDADHVLVLDGGRVVQAGTWQALAETEGPFAKMLAMDPDS